MKVAIIIPVFNRKEKTLGCLAQLSRINHSGFDITIVIVDDGSTDGTGSAVKENFPDTVVLDGDGDLWWTGAINMGIEYALSNGFDGVLLLNDDLVLSTNFIEELYSVVKENNGALVSSLKLLKYDGDTAEIMTAGFNVTGKLLNIENNMQGEIYKENVLVDIIRCDILTGASLYIPLDVVRDIGLLDYSRFPHNWGDLEYTWRASINGYKCLVATRSHIYTEYNPNYHFTYFVSSTRLNYIKNLLNNKKFSYGFKFLFNRSFMHRPIWIGSVLFCRGFMKLLYFLIIKVTMPKKILPKFINAE